MRVRLRCLFTCSVILLLVFAANSCAGSGSGSRSVADGSSGGLSGPDADGDNDSHGEGPPADGDNDAMLSFGRAASASQKRAILVLISRYMSLAAAGRGAQACSLLYFLVSEVTVEEYDRAHRRSSPHGSKCAQVMSRLFSYQHRELVENAAAPMTATVQIRENRAMADVRFGKIRERLVLVHRDGNGWKMDVPVDGVAP